MKDMSKNSKSWEHLQAGGSKGNKEMARCKFEYLFVTTFRFTQSTSIYPDRITWIAHHSITNMQYAITYAALLFLSVLATPAPLKRYAARNPDTTNNIPDGSKVYNSNTNSPADMKTAVNFAWQAKKDGKQYSKFLRITSIGPYTPMWRYRDRSPYEVASPWVSAPRSIRSSFQSWWGLSELIDYVLEGWNEMFT